MCSGGGGAAGGVCVWGGGGVRRGRWGIMEPWRKMEFCKTSMKEVLPSCDVLSNYRLESGCHETMSKCLGRKCNATYKNKHTNCWPF